MPKKLNETRTNFKDAADLREWAENLPLARPVSLFDAAGKPTRFIGIDNGRGEVVASMSKRYGIAQDRVVLLAALDALAARNVPLQSAVIKQSDSRLHARLIFEQSLQFGKDGSDQNLGAIVRNSYDGTCEVESSVFLFRSWCENGSIFGRENVMGGSFKHMGGVEQRLIAGFNDYFANYGAVLEPFRLQMQAAQDLEFDEAHLLAGLRHVGLGERMAEIAGNHLGKYVQEQGSTAYAAYQSATHALTHSGKVGSFMAEDRLHTAAAKLLTSTPYYLDPPKVQPATVGEFTPPAPLV